MAAWLPSPQHKEVFQKTKKVIKKNNHDNIPSPVKGCKDWLGFLNFKPCDAGWTDPTPGSQKELWLTYKDYTDPPGVTIQRHFTENTLCDIKAVNMEIVSAIWRGKVFGGRTEGYGPRTVPLSIDNPYNKKWNPMCPLGEVDVSENIREMIQANVWFRPT